jgi:hypothetical protein
MSAAVMGVHDVVGRVFAVAGLGLMFGASG